MAEYSNLSATINAQIRANGVQAITGPVLNAVLTAMVNVLGDGYRLNGVAVPADNPGSPDNRVAYLAAQDGTYTNFGGLTISGEVALLLWDSAWTKETLFSIDTAVTPGSGHLVTSGAVDDALTTLAGNIAAAYMQLVPAATEGNLSEFNNAGQVRDAGLATSELATKDGVYPDLFAGYAGNLVDTRSAGTPQGPYAFRQSGGDGVDYMVRIKGRTEAFNQLFDKSKAYGGTYRDVVITANSDGSYTYNGVASGGEQFNLSVNHIPLIAGHTYLLTGGKSNDLALRCSDQTSLFDTGNGLVWTAASSGNYALSGRINGGVTYNDTIYVKVVDLTLEGLGLTTADQFRALHPLGYYNYNAGVLKNNAATGIKTRGFNQWDEVAELGTISTTTGENVPDSSKIRSKNYIPVIGGDTYFAACVGSYTGVIQFIEYDASKNFVKEVGKIIGNEYTPSAGAAYIRFFLQSSYGTTYNHDICINISDASRNGTYEPYWERTLQLGITTRKDTDGNVPFADGMKGAGTAADWCDKVGGEIVMGEVDLGSLSWQYSSAFGVFRTASAVPNMKNSAQIICSKYATDNVAADQLGDKEISSVPSFVTGGIMIKDSSYGTDPAAFKTAMNGVKMVFEKDAPVPFTWAEPLNLGVEVDNLGTEERLPADTADNPQGGFESDSNYSVSTANLVRLLNL